MRTSALNSFTLPSAPGSSYLYLFSVGELAGQKRRQTYDLKNLIALQP